jgi:hypothetical protein
MALSFSRVGAAFVRLLSSTTGGEIMRKRKLQLNRETIRQLQLTFARGGTDTNWCYPTGPTCAICPVRQPAYTIDGCPSRIACTDAPADCESGFCGTTFC